MNLLAEAPPAAAGPLQEGESLIEARQLVVEYGVGDRLVRAVDGIDLTIRAN